MLFLLQAHSNSYIILHFLLIFLALNSLAHGKQTLDIIVMGETELHTHKISTKKKSKHSPSFTS